MKILKKKILAIIPCRSGSKSIKDKNEKISKKQAIFFFPLINKISNIKAPNPAKKPNQAALL